jgi:hypothetical protein
VKEGKTTITCDVCKREQEIAFSSPCPDEKIAGMLAHTVGLLGWAQTETGWLCPFHSDRGPTDVLKSIWGGMGKSRKMP